MANNYPITTEEMSQMQGVGMGKSKKYGDEFLVMIDKYVKENDIERPSEMVIKNVANKSTNKIHIIQSLDKKLSIEEQKRIQNELSKDFRSPLKIDYKYDPDLIAGLIIQVGSVMVDTSIKTKLKKLEKNMIEA